MRWRSEEYDKAYRAAEGALNPVKRAALFIKMNDPVVGDIFYRPGVAAISSKLHAPISGWDKTCGT